MPSADVPLITPATIMSFFIMLRSRAFSARFRASSRTCSLNSHSLRESFSAVAADGSFPLRSIFADFFLNCQHSPNRFLDASGKLGVALGCL